MAGSSSPTSSASSSGSRGTSATSCGRSSSTTTSAVSCSGRASRRTSALSLASRSTATTAPTAAPSTSSSTASSGSPRCTTRSSPRKCRRRIARTGTSTSSRSSSFMEMAYDEAFRYDWTRGGLNLLGNTTRSTRTTCFPCRLSAGAAGSFPTGCRATRRTGATRPPPPRNPAMQATPRPRSAALTMRRPLVIT